MTTPSDKSEAAWLLYFDDPDKPVEIFMGAGAPESAAARYKQASINWNCHLFEKVAAPRPESQQRHGSDLVKIDDGQSTHCRTAKEWIDLARADLAARSTTGMFTPTHEHADGGNYQLLGHGKMKGGVGSVWEPCVFYANAEGMKFATDQLRWNARFVPLSATGAAKP